MSSGLNLFVAPLDKNIDDDILRMKFLEYGEILRAAVAKDEFGLSKGFGFVHFVSMEDAVRAIREMNGKTWLSREVHVSIANSQDNRCLGAKLGASIWANELDSPVDHDNDWCDATSVTSDVPDDTGRSGTSDVKDRMRTLFEQQKYCDVTFFPKGNRKTSISGHRAFLAIGSPLFTQMLFGDQSKDTAGMKMEVEISNISFEAFTNIVKYLYTDEVFFESDAQAHDILKGAMEFSITPLMSRCKRHFETIELTVHNVCSKLQMSISNKITVLKDRCTEFIKNHTAQVINSNDFLNCSSTTVRAICNLPSLNLRSETEMLHAVMRWLQAQPLQNRTTSLQPLLKCIRFLTFTVEELASTLKTYTDLMTSEDGLNIMLFLYNPPKTPDFSRLPAWCNKNTKSRCCVTDRKPPSVAGSMRDLRLDEAYVGRVIFPLKATGEARSLPILTSLLQMRCVSGAHQLRAIRLSFRPPVTARSTIGHLSISVHINPSGFMATEKIQVGNSESVRVEFSKTIKARLGDLIDIEVESREVRNYYFLQFDDAGPMPQNPHFQCCVSSRPKEGKCYFIREIEYGPQVPDQTIAARNRRPRKKPS